MSDPKSADNVPAASAPPGWYPVAGTTQQRWWDGTAWTEHVYDPAAAPGAAPLKAPEGTSPSTIWIWLLAVGVPVLGLVSIGLEAVWFNSLSGVDFTDPAAVEAAEFTPTYGLLFLVGVATYALAVVASALDHRALRARGVPRPFHWAWSFLSVIVYVIGRTVVVRRRTGSGMAPLWVFIVLTVATYVASFAVVIGFVSNLGNQIASVSSY